MISLDILRDLIRIDTQNPPGNERAAAEYIATLCEEVGLNYEIHTFNTDRSNIVVRLAPACEERLVILGHLDVVLAGEVAWDHRPFAADIADGYVYGRGALDMKYFVAVALSVLAALKPQEASLTHGITCVFTADEENGSANGLPRLLENESIRRELSNRTVLNEGGGFAYEYDGRWYSLVETGQKSVCRLTVTVPELPSTNPYFPTLDHEVVLNKAIRAVESVDVPAAVPETARELLGRFAGSRGAAQTQVGPGRDAAGEANEGAAISAGLERVRASGDEFMYKLLYAMTHSMTTPTIVRGGSRNPELPRTTKASVTFDCRLLPSVTRGEFEQAVRASLAELPVELTVSSFSQGYETAFTNPIISRAEAALRRHDPRVEACLPFITPGSNDGKYLRPLGCDILGFAPLATSQPFKEVISMIHGINERISLESVTLCTDVMTEICSSYVQGKEDDAQQ